MAPSASSILLVIGLAAACLTLASAQGCDPNSALPNACYNADGSAYICCGVESCPSSPGPIPLCASPPQPSTPGSSISPGAPVHCDPYSHAPNQCHDASGTTSVCCAGQCEGNAPGAPTCAPATPPTIDGQIRGDLAVVNLVITIEGIDLPSFNSTLQTILVTTLKNASSDILAVTIESIRQGSVIASTMLFFEELNDKALKALIKVKEGAKVVLEEQLNKFVIKPVVIPALEVYNGDGLHLPDIPPLPVSISDVPPCSEPCPYNDLVHGWEICGQQCCRYFEGATCPAFPDDPNGCGDKETAWLVPSIIELLGETEKVANLFTPGCNHHDVCYATPGRLKSVCDDELYYRSLNACLKSPIQGDDGLNNCIYAARVMRLFFLTDIKTLKAYNTAQDETTSYAFLKCGHGGADPKRNPCAPPPPPSDSEPPLPVNTESPANPPGTRYVNAKNGLKLKAFTCADSFTYALLPCGAQFVYNGSPHYVGTGCGTDCSACGGGAIGEPDGNLYVTATWVADGELSSLTGYLQYKDAEDIHQSPPAEGQCVSAPPPSPDTSLYGDPVKCGYGPDWAGCLSPTCEPLTTCIDIGNQCKTPGYCTANWCKYGGSSCP